MNVGFTEQHPRTLAQKLAADPAHVLEFLLFERTKQLPRPVGSYTLPHLQALLAYMEDAVKFRLLQVQAAAEADPEGSLWEDPILTGDPVADEWERQIAAGEEPSL